MKLFSLYLTAYQIEKLKEIVKEKGGKVAELIRRAVDEFLKREGK